MNETREFPSVVIASLSSGILLCEFSAMHEAAEYLLGHPVWTHQFANEGIQTQIKSAIQEQCSGMPTDLPGTTRKNWREKAAEIETRFGKWVTIRKGSGATALAPLEGLEGKGVIVIHE